MTRQGELELISQPSSKMAIRWSLTYRFVMRLSVFEEPELARVAPLF